MRQASFFLNMAYKVVLKASCLGVEKLGLTLTTSKLRLKISIVAIMLATLEVLD